MFKYFTYVSHCHWVAACSPFPQVLHEGGPASQSQARDARGSGAGRSWTEATCDRLRAMPGYGMLWLKGWEPATLMKSAIAAIYWSVFNVVALRELEIIENPISRTATIVDYDIKEGKMMLYPDMVLASQRCQVFPTATVVEKAGATMTWPMVWQQSPFNILQS